MDEQWAVGLLALISQPAFAAAKDRVLAVNDAASALGLSVGAALSQFLQPVPDRDCVDGETVSVRLFGREAALRCLNREGILICTVDALPTEERPVSASLLHTASAIRASIQELSVALYRLQADPDLQTAPAEQNVSLGQRSLYQLERTAHQLEQYYRLATGEYHRSCQPVPVRALFYNLCSEAASLLGYGQCPLRFQMPPAEFIGCVDSELITLIFWELISNAAAHGDESGISLQLQRKSKDLLLLTLVNHPTDPVTLPDHLFDRHAVPVELTPEKGAGFGLTLVSMCARLHGGSLVLSADPDGAVRTALSLRMPEKPDDHVRAGRWLVSSSLNYGLVSLSRCLPPKAYHPLALQG